VSVVAPFFLINLFSFIFDGISSGPSLTFCAGLIFFQGYVCSKKTVAFQVLAAYLVYQIQGLA
jgi:hypothetical protein